MCRGSAIYGYTLITVNDLAAFAGTEEWLGATHEYKVWVDALPVCDYMPVTERCRNLWYNTNYSSHRISFDFYEDMDGDGTAEQVSFREFNNARGLDGIGATLKIGNASIDNIHSGDYYVWDTDAVYIIGACQNPVFDAPLIINQIIKDERK